MFTARTQNSKSLFTANVVYFGQIFLYYDEKFLVNLIFNIIKLMADVELTISLIIPIGPIRLIGLIGQGWKNTGAAIGRPCRYGDSLKSGLYALELELDGKCVPNVHRVSVHLTGNEFGK